MARADGDGSGQASAASWTQSQILILQWKKAAEKVLGGGADLGWTLLGCVSAQGTWDWWWQEARGMQWLLR